MSVETKLPHSNQPMSLSKMLLVPSNGGTLTSTVSVTGSPSTVVIDNSPEVAGRDILFRAMLKDDEPVMIPQEYLTECLDADVNVPAPASGAVVGGAAGSKRAYDAVLDRHFVVAPNTCPPVDSTTRHANLQRVYGYSDSDQSYLVLEDFSKGTLATFLKTAKGRVQLNAQRRITIMFNVAQVLNLQKQFAISSHNIGIDNNLNPKVMRLAATDNSCDNEIEAFGILMMELLTGSLQNDGSDDRRLGDFVQRYTTKGHLIEDDLDPYVRESWTFNILSQLVELALNCVHPEQQKPTPQALVDTLSLISSRMRVVDNYDYY